MKKFLILLAFVPALAFAKVAVPVTTGQAQAQANSNSSSVAIGGGGGSAAASVNPVFNTSPSAVAGTNTGANQQNITFNSQVPASTQTHVEYSGTQTIRNVPSMMSSPLVSSNDTCMGSASGSVAGPGFGVNLGKTYVDTNCVRLKNSTQLWNMGMKAAALALMCQSSENKKALEETGYKCPTSKAETVSEAKNEPTDPFIRYRMGLPPLAGQADKPPYKR